ncbi:hypothetical protein [Isoptericola sp. BMS4]|uniref:hypothetical protein n=1 Tax=Isoptericola sp. BMS4 TaxID=2527875 RepID=UPI0014229320|nr:hypothetical protein [Isoptericola sp. BMS4]
MSERPARTTSPAGVRGYAVRALVPLVAVVTAVAGVVVFGALDWLVAGLAAAATFTALTVAAAIPAVRLSTYELRLTHDADAGTLDVARRSWAGSRTTRLAVEDVVAWYYLDSTQALTIARRTGRPLRFVLHVPATSRAHGDSPDRMVAWLAESPLGSRRDLDHERDGDRRARRRLVSGLVVGVPVLGVALAGTLLLVAG